VCSASPKAYSKITVAILEENDLVQPRTFPSTGFGSRTRLAYFTQERGIDVRQFTRIEDEWIRSRHSIAMVKKLIKPSGMIHKSTGFFATALSRDQRQFVDQAGCGLS